MKPIDKKTTISVIYVSLIKFSTSAELTKYRIYFTSCLVHPVPSRQRVLLDYLFFILFFKSTSSKKNQFLCIVSLKQLSIINYDVSENYDIKV